jgi:hypothetical protein
MTSHLIISRREVIGLSGELVLLVFLVGLIVWLSFTVQDIRRQILLSQQQQEFALEDVGRAAALRAAVEGEGDRLNRILAYVPEEATIGDVISELEREAARLGLSLSIPVVQEASREEEEEESEEEGAAEEPAVLRDVELRVVVNGPPQRVLQFLHAVEYLPYLVQVNDWEFHAEGQTTPPGRTAVIPGGGPLGAAGTSPASEVPVGPEADLTLGMLLAVRNFESDEH